MSNIEYLSAPNAVSMADRWFEIASTEHFWIRRRFEVLRRLAGDFIENASEVAEIGCGHGLLQRQIEDHYKREVAGFDLNEYALKQNVSRRSRVFCYDVFQKARELENRFDLLFLFDVLEHISDEDSFVQALRFHLKARSKLAINVPAGQWAFSAYDRAAGHVRRYSHATLRGVLARNGFEEERWTYWGLPLVPTLAVRKLWLMGRRDERGIISSGFDSRSRMVNGILAALSRMELIPQNWLGTSVMSVFRLNRTEGANA